MMNSIEDSIKVMRCSNPVYSRGREMTEGFIPIAEVVFSNDEIRTAVEV